MSESPVLDTTLEAPTSPEAILANSHAVLDAVRNAADDIERAGHLTPEIERLFRDAGFFQMAFPASRGGLEMTLEQQVEVVTRIARADGSAGWNVGVLNATGFYAGRLDQAAYDELYPDRDAPTAGSFHPRGRADRVDGGWLITGTWDWGSGSYSATHVLGGCFAFDGDEPVIAPSGQQLVLGVWLPRESIVPAHNWQVLGVRGSGSTTYSVPVPAFVPDAHTFDREALPSADNDPMNKTVHAAFFGLAGVALGLAQHAVDLASASVARKAQAKGTAKAVDTASLQSLGEAIADVDACYAGVLEIARQGDRILFESGRGISAAQIARLMSAQALGVAMLKRVLPICVDLASAKFLFDGDPMQRVIRDSYGAFAHVGGRKMQLGGMAAALLDEVPDAVLLVDDIDRKREASAVSA
jgi:alkylation response protein AidB-like acyl-CoA dehydrogenase